MNEKLCWVLKSANNNPITVQLWKLGNCCQSTSSTKIIWPCKMHPYFPLNSAVYFYFGPATRVWRETCKGIPLIIFIVGCSFALGCKWEKVRAVTKCTVGNLMFLLAYAQWSKMKLGHQCHSHIQSKNTMYAFIKSQTLGLPATCVYSVTKP